MLMRSLRPVALLTAALLPATLQSARAQTTYTGTTTGKPTWNRPVENGFDAPVALSDTASADPYNAFAFTAAATGYYDFLSVATTPAGWDNYTFLYSGGFDATQPLNNVLLGNDDLGSVGRSGFNGVSLTAGTRYYFVTTGFSNTDYGVFTDTVKVSAYPPLNTFTYNGSTTGGGVWDRPIANGNAAPTQLSSFANPDHYAALAFNVTLSGTYNLLSKSTNPANWDNYAFLYQKSFNPNAPLQNVLLGNDDLTVTGTAGFDNVTLLAGTTYYFVTTGYDVTDFGDFTATITGAGNVVPEPGILIWLGVAAGTSALVLRRRAALAR